MQLEPSQSINQTENSHKRFEISHMSQEIKHRETPACDIFYEGNEQACHVKACHELEHVTYSMRDLLFLVEACHVPSRVCDIFYDKGFGWVKVIHELECVTYDEGLR